MELESIEDDSEQAATYDHLNLDSIADVTEQAGTLGPLPDVPETPPPDTEDP